jgi:hypothetical protein
MLASPHHTWVSFEGFLGELLEFWDSKVQNCRAFSRPFSRVFLNNGLENNKCPTMSSMAKKRFHSLNFKVECNFIP